MNLHSGVLKLTSTVSKHILCRLSGSLPAVANVNHSSSVCCVMVIMLTFIYIYVCIYSIYLQYNKLCFSFSLHHIQLHPQTGREGHAESNPTSLQHVVDRHSAVLPGQRTFHFSSAPVTLKHVLVTCLCTEESLRKSPNQRDINWIYWYWVRSAPLLSCSGVAVLGDQKRG